MDKAVRQMTLHEKQKLFAMLFGQFLVKLHMAGYEVKIGEVKRTKARALLNAVTGKGIAKSLHLDLIAVDIELYKDDQWLRSRKDYKEAAEIWTSLHSLCRAGYYWATRYDPNHFSLEHEGRE